MADTTDKLYSSCPPFGQQTVTTSRGDVLVVDAPGLSVGTATRPTGESSITVLAYDPDPTEDGHGLGMIAQLSPDAARGIAASLLKLADQLDPRKPH